MIRALEPGDVEACIAVGEAAWRPVYEDFRRLEGDDLFRRLYPDFERPRVGDVERLTTDERRGRWVAEDGGHVVGFAVALPEEATGLGHLNVVAVAPQHQGRGVGSALAAHAVEEMRRAGMVHTLGVAFTVPAHDPARRVLAGAGLESMSIQPVQFVLPLDGVPAAGAPPGVRPATAADVERCRELGLAAFQPVFASFEREYGRDLYERLRPGGEQEHADFIAAACADPDGDAWVLETDGDVVGLLVLVDEGRGVGRIELLAVDPAHQGRGVGGTLNRFALSRFAAAGSSYAVVGTGNDPGHGPARASYRAAGFRPRAVQWDMHTGKL